MHIEDIWSEYRASLKSFLSSRIYDSDEVDDLLQEILIKTHDKLHTIRSESSIKSWLFQVANNAIMDFYRKKSRLPEFSDEEPWYVEEEINSEHPLLRCIEPFIQALPEESAGLLTAIDLEGQSQKAYAEELGISYSTLKSRVQKSRSQLRSLFEKCCHLTLDSSGNIYDCDAKSGHCDNC